MHTATLLYNIGTIKNKRGNYLWLRGKCGHSSLQQVKTGALWRRVKQKG